MPTYKEIKDIEEYIDMLRAYTPEDEILLYQKFDKISFRRGQLGEKIITKNKDGKIIKEKVVKLDKKTKKLSWVIKETTSGKEWVISDSKFEKRYENESLYSEFVKNDKGIFYEKIGIPVFAFKVLDDIYFYSLPTKIEMIEEGGYLVLASDGPIYGVSKEKFPYTHARCNQSGKFLNSMMNKAVLISTKSR